MCVQVCPKDVKPMDQILKLRSAAVHENIRNNNGSRHTLAFVELVGANGRLDEFRLPVFTEGKFNFVGQLSYLPSAPRMIRSGKMPPLFPHKITGVKHVKRIFKTYAEKEVLPPRVRVSSHGGH
jgi:succinate dehydrogenase / fumarate reductase iron-sulfur subunit